LAAGGLGDIRRAVEGARPDHKLSDIRFLPVIPDPDKILCVGINYRSHAAEVGRDLPAKPSLFIRLTNTLIGHDDEMIRPRVSTHLDFEGELAVIIGRGGRYIKPEQALDHVAGYSIGLDMTARGKEDRSFRKSIDSYSVLGPWMVTADEIPPNTRLTLSCRLNGERMQHATTEQMIFKIPKIIEYVSTWTTLAPGDVLVTGTPGGVGARRNPPIWMKPGDKVEIEIDKVGILENTIADG
jgi:2-keto-4-pentenoate hydratase/2-oxohepta-3-ene-1,7-dioic acid hydratase in catechol pathway